MSTLRLTPNTILGEVYWHCDAFFGTLLPVCQGMLGLDPADKYDHKFIDSKQHTLENLREFFEEFRLENGNLGMCLLMGANETQSLADIHTTHPYGLPIDDQTFLNFVHDLIEYVGSLPLADISNREGALWTDEDIERGYCEAANQLYVEAMQQFTAALDKVAEEVDAKSQKQSKDENQP